MLDNSSSKSNSVLLNIGLQFHINKTSTLLRMTHRLVDRANCFGKGTADELWVSLVVGVRDGDLLNRIDLLRPSLDALS